MSRPKATDNTKKKPARVAAGPQAPGFARSVGESTGLLLRPLVPLGLLIAVYAGGSYLLWRPVCGDSVEGSAAQSRLTRDSIRKAVLQKPRPPWISREDFEQSANLGLIGQSRSVFEANLSRTLAAQYETSPWVERVQTVKLRFPAQMEIEIDWRKPAARIDHSNMVLDRCGVVLNLMSDSAAVRDIPLVSGVLCGRTDAGKQVPEKELLDGLELINVVREALQQSPGNLKVATVQREPSGMWRVITDRGPAVYWGFFTDDPPIDEPRTREKADLLRRRLCETKDPGLLEYIKVYHASAPVKPRATR